MARIRNKNTRPEMLVRRLLHRAGYRYRVHVRALPGTPDLAFARRKKAVFVHGCFWHRHGGCNRATLPSTRPEFWSAKLARNEERDRQAAATLMRMGWSILVIWECEIRRPDRVSARLKEFLGAPKFKAEGVAC